MTLRWTSLISTAGFAVVLYGRNVREHIKILARHDVKVSHKPCHTY